MMITATALAALRTGFSAAFKKGLSQAESDYKRIAFTVPSTTRETTYGWLGKFPNLREWIGARVVQVMAEHAYTIVNKDYEETVGVDRNDIKDDNLGIYGTMFEQMGMAVAALPDQLVFGALANGFSSLCYDGQFFFDTDHPVLDAQGSVVTVSNMATGSSPAWFLLDVSQPLKPIIFQEREAFTFVSRDKPDDDNVFFKKQYIYGTDGRCNVGYGFWQMAFGSRQDLTATSYEAARAAIRGMKGDYGRPLGLGRKLLLVVPTGLEGAALEILNAERDASGATNVWKGTADLLVTSWLG